MKINLSFPPEFPRSPINTDYFKVPHEVIGKTGLAGFHERTISRTSGLAKDRARWRIVNTFLRTAPKDLPNLYLLTTPGAWWHFERLIEGRIQHDHAKQKPHFLCFERDAEMYSLAAVMMATIFNGSGAVVKRDGDIDCVTSRRGSKILRNQDVFEYLGKAPFLKKKRFAGIWLDLTSVITDKLPQKLAILRPWIRPDYCMLAITLIRGRESGEVRSKLQEGRRRKRILERMVQESCGEDFRIADLFDYSDSMPMQQVIFLRGTTLGAHAPRSNAKKAMEAALSARFEFGESGAANAK
jgi:hypothetical protein